MSASDHSQTSSSAATRSASPPGPDKHQTEVAPPGGATESNRDNNIKISGLADQFVGWAKAHLRRAHHPSPNASLDGGHASLCPPYGLRFFSDFMSHRPVSQSGVKLGRRGDATPQSALPSRTNVASRASRSEKRRQAACRRVTYFPAYAAGDLRRWAAFWTTQS